MLKTGPIWIRFYCELSSWIRIWAIWNADQIVIKNFKKVKNICAWSGWIRVGKILEPNPIFYYFDPQQWNQLSDFNQLQQLFLWWWGWINCLFSTIYSVLGRDCEILQCIWERLRDFLYWPWAACPPAGACWARLSWAHRLLSPPAPRWCPACCWRAGCGRRCHPWFAIKKYRSS